MISSSTQSYEYTPRRSEASVNVEAVSTTYCSLRRVRAINSHSEGSSSTINIFMMDIRFIGKDMKPILERI